MCVCSSSMTSSAGRRVGLRSMHRHFPRAIPASGQHGRWQRWEYGSPPVWARGRCPLAIDRNAGSAGEGMTLTSRSSPR
uniref:Uncharacterized protein n=1 Tax=Tanacetum cinerariifolium TaxID=118510 RepID=A0A699TJT9_TANCI|nr:hypothetical protein [Tanacetum cinerariifolium]